MVKLARDLAAEGAGIGNQCHEQVLFSACIHDYVRATVVEIQLVDTNTTFRIFANNVIFLGVSGCASRIRMFHSCHLSILISP